MTTTIATVRQSPFRETEWDRRLDNMLEDLENSAAANSGGVCATSSSSMQQPQSSNVSHQVVSHSTSQSSSATQLQRNVSSHQQSSSSNTSGVTAAPSDTGTSHQNGYGSVLQKSESGSNLQKGSADGMLKEMDTGLKAASNFIESHRSSSSVAPGSRSTQEYHEYRSYSNGGTGGHGGGGGEFNLERQVQHMMPPPSPSLSGLMERSNQPRNISNLASSNVQSYQQQQQQSYTTYKVQSNQYSSSSANQMISSQGQDISTQDGERPGSRLKQNIDELDTLLSDLNNARKGDVGGDYNLSSEDYSIGDHQQGHVSRQVRSLNDYNYQTGSSASAKPPSPSPRRRSDDRSGGRVLASPSTVRKVSPSPNSTSTPRRHGRDSSPPGVASYSSTSAYHSEQQQQKTTTSSLQEYHRSSSPYSPDRGSPAPGAPPRSTYPASPTDGTPTGVSYYTKYHSTHSHHSQQPNGTVGAPISFPTGGSPSKYTQSPPKRVDELMTELSEFDPSIQPTGFIEPSGPPKSHITETQYKSTTESDFGGRVDYKDRSVSPPKKQSSTPGPAVYYPPGEIFSSTKQCTPPPQPSAAPVIQASQSTSLEQGRSAKAKGREQYGYKTKGRYEEAGDQKQGAAVVPICLPLCCAAPCVIL